MRVTFQERNTYIPSWNGNKKEPESTQIKVHWRYPTAEEVKAIRSHSNPRVSMKGKKKEDIENVEIEIVVDDLMAVKLLVTDIEKLEVNGQEIKTGGQLVVCPGLSQLVNEVAAEIMNEMDKVRANSKNS